jgi:predicted nuclease with TOPRIM domain
MGMQVIASKDEEIDELKKRLKEATDIIAGLKKDLEEAKAALTAKDAQITELQAHLSKLDEELAAELAKEQALAKQLAEEKRKEEELEAYLNKTKVCFRGEMKVLMRVCAVTDTNMQADGLTFAHAHISGGPREGQRGPGAGPKGEGAGWSRACAPRACVNVGVLN